VWQLYEEMLVLAKDLKKAMVTGYMNGDRSAADTLEAHTIMRQREVQRAEALIKYNEARLKLEAFLGEQIPKERIPESINPNQVIPSWADTTQIRGFIDSHPMRRQYENKVMAAESELKLKREQLRPELQLYYNYLSDKDNLQFAVEDQAMMGLKFKLPLFLRKERGGFREYQAKVKENESALEWAELKIEAMLNQELTAIQLQYDLFKQSYAFAAEMRQLLTYERRMFDIGESSLFKINQREYYYAISEVDAIKAYAAYHAQLIRWKVANGTAYQEWKVLE
jgi:outer membrane protein TolC